MVWANSVTESLKSDESAVTVTGFIYQQNISVQVYSVC